jgi:hypothetical protein
MGDEVVSEPIYVRPQELAAAFDLAMEAKAGLGVTPGQLFVEYLAQAGMVDRQKVDRRYVTAVWNAAKHV